MRLGHSMNQQRNYTKLIDCKMNPNIYEFAHTEYAQDAFIAWMCSCYDRSTNPFKRQIAEKFIKELLGVNVDIQSVEVKTQEKNIDILLNLNDGQYYVIIEDKKYSSIHDQQLRKYVESLKKKDIPESQIFVVYYKTGHISSTPNCIYFRNGNYYSDASKPSEKQEVQQVKQSFPELSGLKICSIHEINSFFQSVSDLIKKSGSEILEDYAAAIQCQYKQYMASSVDAKEGRRDEIWGKIFDDFIINVAKPKYKNLSFKLDYYSGNYWEIYITGLIPQDGDEHDFSGPILNVRSDIFEGKTQRIYFFHLEDLPKFEPMKKYTMSMSYVIPWGNFRRQHLNECNYLGEEVDVKDINLLLEAICDEFNRSVIEDGESTFGL